RQGVSHDRAAQRAPGRSAELRRAGDGSRQQVQGGARLSRARRRDAEPGRARRGDVLMAKMRGLGRGLDALLNAGGDAPREKSEVMRDVPRDALEPGRFQPRTHMDGTALEELAESIRSQGMIRPIVVRPLGDGRYEILAGERRWRAAGMAGLERVPVIVRDVPDRAAMALALIENIQREDLNPL